MPNRSAQMRGLQRDPWPSAASARNELQPANFTFTRENRLGEKRMDCEKSGRPSGRPRDNRFCGGVQETGTTAGFGKRRSRAVRGLLACPTIRATLEISRLLNDVPGLQPVGKKAARPGLRQPRQPAGAAPGRFIEVAQRRIHHELPSFQDGNSSWDRGSSVFGAVARETRAMVLDLEGYLRGSEQRKYLAKGCSDVLPR